MMINSRIDTYYKTSYIRVISKSECISLRKDNALMNKIELTNKINVIIITNCNEGCVGLNIGAFTSSSMI